MTEPDATAARKTEAFRVAYVEGVMPGKWLDRWAERHPDLPLDASLVTHVEPADFWPTAEEKEALARAGTDGRSHHGAGVR